MKTREVFEFYKELYFFELDRRDRLNSAVALPVAVLTLIVGAIVYYLDNFPASDTLAGIIFLVLLGAVMASTSLAIFHLIRGRYNYEYYHLPRTSDIDEYRFDLKKCYEEAGEGISGEFEEAFLDFLIGEFVLAGHVNAGNNKTKSGELHKSINFIIGALVSLVLRAFPFYLIR